MNKQTFIYELYNNKVKNITSLPGFEPGIFWSVVRRVIHCATSPWKPYLENNGHNTIVCKSVPAKLYFMLVRIFCLCSFIFLDVFILFDKFILLKQLCSITTVSNKKFNETFLSLILMSCMIARYLIPTNDTLQVFD